MTELLDPDAVRRRIADLLAQIETVDEAAAGHLAEEVQRLMDQLGDAVIHPDWAGDGVVVIGIPRRNAPSQRRPMLRLVRDGDDG